jgi:hypothetical protein
LLLLQTPGLAERKVGRSLKFNRKAAHGHELALPFQFLGRLGFLALLYWFRGWIHDLDPLFELGLTCPPGLIAIDKPKRKCFTALFKVRCLAARPTAESMQRA